MTHLISSTPAWRSRFLRHIWVNMCFIVITGGIPLFEVETSAAGWNSTGAPLCTASGTRANVSVAPSDSGSVYAAWGDYRAGVWQTYLQNLDANGDVAAGWPQDGLLVSGQFNDLGVPIVVHGDSGRVIVVWSDQRYGSSSDVFAQSYEFSGQITYHWPPAGAPVCTAAGSQILQSAISDNMGGAIIAWWDKRTLSSNVYVQRIRSDGTPASGWPSDGVPVSQATGKRYGPVLTSDGAQGAIVGWIDTRNGNPDVFAQHIMSSGMIDSAWQVDGLPVCTDSSSQRDLAITNDGAGGAFLVWVDERDPSYVLYAQDIRSGSCLWGVNGARVATANNTVPAPQLACLGTQDTAIVVWLDGRLAGANVLYAQALNQSGTPVAGWPADGVAVNTAFNIGYAGVNVLEDGAGGVYVNWSAAYDYLGTAYDIYLTDLAPSGRPNSGWPSGGRALFSLQGNQEYPRYVRTSTGDIILVWLGMNASVTGVYAGKVTPDGTVPTLFSRVLAAEEAGTVHLRWYGADLAGEAVRLDRWNANDASTKQSYLTVNASGLLDVVDRDVIPGTAYGYRLYALQGSPGTLLDSVTVSIAKRGILKFEAVRPIPASSEAFADIEFGSTSVIRLECLDITGRCWFRKEVHDSGTGRCTVVLSELKTMPSGVYIVLARQGNAVATSRVVVTH
jgi:hypothetical protein